LVKPYVRGIQEEWLTPSAENSRAVMMPDDSIVGSEKAEEVSAWDGFMSMPSAMIHQSLAR
jgi:hypothetical protein